MRQEELVFVGICDLAGLVRGKGFPATELDGRLRQGIGLTPSNIMISAFGPILATPFGTTGDLVMMPDPTTAVQVPFDEGAAEHFYLADLRELDGTPWSCCPRDFLRRALAALEVEAGLVVKSAFEQEFVYTGVEDRPGCRLCARFLSPPGCLRREPDRRAAGGGARARQLPAGIRAAPVRGDGEARDRAPRRR